MVTMRRVLCVGLIATVGWVGSASAATSSGGVSPSLQIVGPESLELTVNADGVQTKPVTVWLRNASQDVVRPRFAAQLEDPDGTPGDIVTVTPEEGSTFRSVPAQGVQRYRIVLRGVDETNSSTGQLVVTVAKASGSSHMVSPATVSVSVAPTRDYGNTLEFVLFGTGLFAFALVLIRWATLAVSPTQTIAPANRSFSSGFASTLTVVGAVFGTIVAAGLLPADTAHLASASYTALNVIFAAMIACGVLIFSAFQKQVRSKDGLELLGYVGTFMLACAVTAWAAFGELVTLWFLVWDINGTSGFTSVGVVVLDIMIVSAFGAMVIYLIRRIGQIAGKGQAYDAAAERTADQATVAAVADAAVEAATAVLVGSVPDAPPVPLTPAVARATALAAATIAATPAALAPSTAPAPPPKFLL
jgi:hypothetical protein